MSQFFLTSSANSSTSNHHFSNLKIGSLIYILSPNVIIRELWSLIREHSDFCQGYLASQSDDIKILSKVAIMGHSWLFDQVKVLVRSLMSIIPHLVFQSLKLLTTLKLILSLLFFIWDLIIKSPPLK
jgi:hypothetical protein